MELHISRQIFEKYSKHQFQVNPACGAELLYADGRTDGRTDTTKLIVAFRKFANALKNT